MLTLKELYNNKVLVSISLSVLVTILCFQNLVFYLIPNTSLFVFLAITPFVFTINKNEKRLRFAWVSLVFIVLYFFFKMQLLYFLSFSSFILFIIESNLGKVNSLPLFIILLISPYSSFIFNVFGFPARLLLTEVATSILSFVYDNVASSGNNILINNKSFSVDPECIGLTMVGYGYATTLIFINAFERKFERKLRLSKILGILTISTIFIVIVNLFRIVTIVILQSKPETVTHELIGLLSFGLYFILPLFFISKWIVKSSKPRSTKLSIRDVPHGKLVAILSILLISFLAYFNLNRANYRNIQVDNKSSNIELMGYTKSITKENVIKFENNKSLIYIKPSCHFFGPDHSPTICWKGSGYDFMNIKIENIGAFEIYTAELKKEDEILQTAWWFDNGKDKTTSQLDWRWKTALGDEPYRLINVTSVSKKELNMQIHNLIMQNLFKESNKKINKLKVKG
jgi:exosortase N